MADVVTKHWNTYGIFLKTSSLTNIIFASSTDKPLWDDYVLNHPHGIAYQLFAFREAIEKAFGFKCIYLMAMNGNRVQGILPLVHVHVPGLKGSLVSLPYCDAGAILADSPSIHTRLLTHALSLAKEMGISSVVVRSIVPVAGINPEVTRHPGKVRLVLSLPDNSDKLLAGFKAKVRSQIKKPLKDGLTFHLGGRELCRPFFRIFAENMRDLGSPVHSFNWIHQVMKSFGNRAHIGVVRLPDHTPVAAGIVLCHPARVSIPWASSLRRWNSLNPNMLLYWHFLKFSTNAGYPLFDFGRSTPQEGTFRFKKQWGALPESLHWGEFSMANHQKIICHGIQNTTAVSSTQDFLSRTIMAMPLSLSTCLGSITRRFITL